jgi:hypothetical protein
VAVVQYTAKGREMLTKAIEIRDKFIAAIAIKLIPDDEGQRYLLRRAGYGFGRPTERCVDEPQ